MCILGNKCDLKEQRKVAADEALMYAASIGALFFETSALTNEGMISNKYSLHCYFPSFTGYELTNVVGLTWGTSW